MAAKKSTKKPAKATAPVKKNDKTLAIVGLLLNVLIWPGLGTIINKEVGKGILQMVLILISIPLMFVLVGFPLAIGVWIWALITSINQLNNAE